MSRKGRKDEGREERKTNIKQFRLCGYLLCVEERRLLFIIIGLLDGIAQKTQIESVESVKSVVG